MTTIGAVGTTTDDELVRRALDHDQAAWRELVDRYTRLVWHVIHGFPQLDPDRKADVHQTVWLRLAEQLDALRDPSRIGGWLASTARHECIRVSRLAGREIPDDDLGDRPIDGDVDRSLLDDERDRALWHAFAQLKPDCQQLLRLLLADPPFSYDEIAEVLDMARGSIGPTRGRCLAQLRRLLDEPQQNEAPRHNGAPRRKEAE